jgi:hypothetical protein
LVFPSVSLRVFLVGHPPLTVRSIPVEIATRDLAFDLVARLATDSDEVADGVAGKGDGALEDADDEAGKGRLDETFFVLEVIRNRTDRFPLVDEWIRPHFISTRPPVSAWNQRFSSPGRITFRHAGSVTVPAG